MCVYHVSVSNVHFDDVLESCFSSCSWTSSKWRWGCGVRISQNSPSVSHPIYNSPQFGPILLTFDVLHVFAMGIIWISIFRYLCFIDFHDRSLQEDPYHNRCPLVTPLSFACCLCKPWMIALSMKYIKGVPHRKHLATAKRWEYIPQSFNAWYYLQRRHHLLTCFPKNLCQMLKSSQDLEDLLIYKLWELLSQKTSKASAKSRHLLRLLRLGILHLNRRGSLGKIRLPSHKKYQNHQRKATMLMQKILPGLHGWDKMCLCPIAPFSILSHPFRPRIVRLGVKVYLETNSIFTSAYFHNCDFSKHSFLFLALKTASNMAAFFSPRGKLLIFKERPGMTRWQQGC